LKPKDSPTILKRKHDGKEEELEEEDGRTTNAIFSKVLSSYKYFCLFCW